MSNIIKRDAKSANCPRYSSFMDVITRTLYGTDIEIYEFGSEKLIFAGKWTIECSVMDFTDNILEAEVIQFGVDENQLRIEIIL